MGICGPIPSTSLIASHVKPMRCHQFSANSRDFLISELCATRRQGVVHRAIRFSAASRTLNAQQSAILRMLCASLAPDITVAHGSG